mmetsp:Transcript_51391/g.132598  ORF Transcript_51391/g.132598 Transcript_51391/m.132598 type:complete len:241 (-) Transcript_51391:314-1036(-)
MGGKGTADASRLGPSCCRRLGASSGQAHASGGGELAARAPPRGVQQAEAVELCLHCHPHATWHGGDRVPQREGLVGVPRRQEARRALQGRAAALSGGLPQVLFQHVAVQDAVDVARCRAGREGACGGGVAFRARAQSRAQGLVHVLPGSRLGQVGGAGVHVVPRVAHGGGDIQVCERTVATQAPAASTWSAAWLLHQRPCLGLAATLRPGCGSARRDAANLGSAACCTSANWARAFGKAL